MPCLDMPIEKLKVYQGMSPCPSDIDEYWDNALIEMRNTDSNAKMIPAKFSVPGVKCYDLFFNGVNNARIHAKAVMPEKKEKKLPAVLLFHGYSGRAPDWSSLLSYAACGLAVFAMDVRGQAGESEDTSKVKGNTLNGHIIRGLMDEDPNKLLFRDIFLDCAQLAQIVINFDFIDETKVGAYGGSQGGGLTIACCALEPKIKKAYAAFPFLCDYKRVWDMDMDERAYAELKQFFRSFDPRHEREDEIFTKLGYIDLQNIAGRIKADFTMFTGLRDDVCPPSTQFAAYNKMTCPKKSILYPEFGHEHLPDSDDIVLQGFVQM